MLSRVPSSRPQAISRATGTGGPAAAGKITRLTARAPRPCAPSPAGPGATGGPTRGAARPQVKRPIAALPQRVRAEPRPARPPAVGRRAKGVILLQKEAIPRAAPPVRAGPLAAQAPRSSMEVRVRRGAHVPALGERVPAPSAPPAPRGARPVVDGAATPLANSLAAASGQGGHLNARLRAAAPSQARVAPGRRQARGAGAPLPVSGGRASAHA